MQQDGGRVFNIVPPRACEDFGVGEWEGGGSEGRRGQGGRKGALGKRGVGQLRRRGRPEGGGTAEETDVCSSSRLIGRLDEYSGDTCDCRLPSARVRAAQTRTPTCTGMCTCTCSLYPTHMHIPPRETAAEARICLRASAPAPARLRDQTCWMKGCITWCPGGA